MMVYIVCTSEHATIKYFSFCNYVPLIQYYISYSILVQAGFEILLSRLETAYLMLQEMNRIPKLQCLSFSVKSQIAVQNLVI